MNVDVIILSNAAYISKYGMTQRAINSLKDSEDAVRFNPIIVETNTAHRDKGFIYSGSTVITPDQEFNYNKFLNFGLEKSTSEWIVIANNDITFTKGWFYELMKCVRQHGYLSLSPYEPDWHAARGMPCNVEHYEGYRPAHELTGWCIVVHRSVINKCNLFDERFKFWYQDNDYAMTIREAGIKHALVTKSIVYHGISGSHDTVSSNQLHDMTNGQASVYYEKWAQRAKDQNVSLL